MPSYDRRDRSGRRRSPHSANRRRRPKGLIPIIKYASARLGRRLLRSPLVPVIGGLVLLALALGTVVWAFTNKNAYDVYVGDELVVSIARSKDITGKWIYDNALAKLVADLGTNVQVDRELALKPAHRSRKEISPVDAAIGEVYKVYSDSEYMVEAAEILVNGIPIVVLKNAAEAQSVLDAVMMSYVPAGVTPIEKGFVDDAVEVVSRFINGSEIESAERAIVKLTVTTETESIYTVRDGDSAWRISRQQGISQDRLVELNPEITDFTRLVVGQQIKIVTPKPICSVRTVEEVVYQDVEQRTVEERPVARPKSYRNTIQTGKDGQREVLAHLVRINGVEMERNEVSSTTLVAPVVEIIEVGTL